MNNILLRQLKNQLQSRSVNSVKYIYPEELLDMIGCDDHRAEQFIIWLNAERLLKYIYVVNCKCGETVYVHENRLFYTKDDIYCSRCGFLFGRDEIKRKGQLMYSLNKQAIMDYDDETLQWKKRGYKQNIIPMRVSENVEDFIMKKKKVFIGSSKEAEEELTIISAMLDDLGAEARPWNSLTNPVFVAGNYTLDSLFKVAEEVDCSFFLFNADDEIWYTEYF